MPMMDDPSAVPVAPETEDVGMELLNPTMPNEALSAVFGPEFPAARRDLSRRGWATWVNALWDSHGAAMQARMHLVERNRLFRKGVQWVSSLGIGHGWRQPPMARDAVRVVENIVGPALDLRDQIVTENRPGVRVVPSSADPDDMKRAEAAQIVAEYHYDAQNMDAVRREARYWAGTDGVSFLEIHWDPDAGPWDELPVLDQQGGLVLGPDGVPVTSPAQLGDVRTRVRRIEQVRVSAEATATVPPRYIMVRETIPLGVAVLKYGPQVLDMRKADDSMGQWNLGGTFKNGYELPEIGHLYRDQRTVDRTVLYAVPSELVPQGLMVVSVGSLAVFVGALPTGDILPVVPVRDGSSDPAYFPAPKMDDWIDAQQRLNAVKSRWVEAVRANAGGKVMAREGAIVSETFTQGMTTVLSVRDPRPFQDLLVPFPQMSVGNDAKELLASERKNLEDLTGWNDTSRGQISEDQSGRAILAIREQLERAFAPDVAAVAKALTDWAKVTLAWVRWGYQLPRLVSVVGEGRPDLSRQLTGQDVDGVSDIQVDAETMMPMPRSLKLFILNDLLAKGVIGPQEFRRRFPFAWTRNLNSADDDQEARARRVVEAIRQSGNPAALPMLWVDDEATHQDALERELILPDDIDPRIREAAWVRWQMLATQAMSKMAPMQAMGGAPAGPAAPGLGGDQQPTMAAGDSPVAANSDQVGMTQQTGALAGMDSTAGRQFDQQQPIG